MGISSNLIPSILDAIRAYELSGTILMLGRQDIEPSKQSFAKILSGKRFVSAIGQEKWQEERGHLTAESFFQALGFGQVNTLDVAKANESSIQFDLNSSETPESLKNRFDVIFDGGSLHHVFHLPNALARCTEMLRPSGALVHIGPMNNYVDHGFYQFSPALWFDWFAANGWTVLESVMVKLPSIGDSDTSWAFSPLPQFKLGTVGELDKSPYMHFYVAKKSQDARFDRIPRQSYYVNLSPKQRESSAKIREFGPFSVTDGIVRTDHPALRGASRGSGSAVTRFFNRIAGKTRSL